MSRSFNNNWINIHQYSSIFINIHQLGPIQSIPDQWPPLPTCGDATSDASDAERSLWSGHLSVLGEGRRQILGQPLEKHAQILRMKSHVWKLGLAKSGVLSCFISPLFMRKAFHIFHAFSIFLYCRSFWLQLLIITERKQTAAEANGKIPAQTTKVTGNLTQISSFRWCWFQPKHIRLTGSAIAGPCLGWKMQKDILKPSNQVNLNPSS